MCIVENVRYLLFYYPQGSYIRCVSELLDSPSHAVKYEAANILMFLTSNPVAVKGW